MSFAVPELRLFWAEEQAKKQREREKQRHRKPIIPEGRADRANAKEEGREMKRRPGGAARIAVILVTILPALVGAAGGGFAQPMDGADREIIDALMAQAQQAASAAGTGTGTGIFTSAQDECRTAFEIEWLQRAAQRDGMFKADDGLGPNRTITPPPHPPGLVSFAALPRADVHLERIRRCLQALSWGLGAQQLLHLDILRDLQAQMEKMRREIAELKRER